MSRRINFMVMFTSIANIIMQWSTAHEITMFTLHFVKISDYMFICFLQLYCFTAWNYDDFILGNL